MQWNWISSTKNSRNGWSWKESCWVWKQSCCIFTINWKIEQCYWEEKQWNQIFEWAINWNGQPFKTVQGYQRTDEKIGRWKWRSSRWSSTRTGKIETFCKLNQQAENRTERFQNVKRWHAKKTRPTERINKEERRIWKQDFNVLTINWKTERRDWKEEQWSIKPEQKDARNQRNESVNR